MKKVANTKNDKGKAPAKPNRAQRRQAAKGNAPSPNDPILIKQKIRKQDIPALKGDIADFYEDIEKAEAMEAKADQLRLQAKRIREIARQNIALRREIIAEKEARLKAKKEK